MTQVQITRKIYQKEGRVVREDIILDKMCDTFTIANISADAFELLILTEYAQDLRIGDDLDCRWYYDIYSSEGCLQVRIQSRPLSVMLFDYPDLQHLYAYLNEAAQKPDINNVDDVIDNALWR